MEPKLSKEAFARELARIQALPLHPFTIRKMITHLFHVEALKERGPLSIHPRNWYLVDSRYQPGTKQNTSRPPRQDMLRAA